MSEALKERSDGTDWLGGKVCPVCGKQFAVLYPHLWRYKRPKRGGEHYFCSWGCLRAYDKEGEQKMGARAILTEADRNEAVRLAMDGGDPAEFLRSKGIKDPHGTWYKIKQTVKECNPEIYEKIPDRRIARKEAPKEPVTKQAVIKAVKDTVRAVNKGKQKPKQEEEDPFPCLTTGISTPIGDFRYYAKQQYLDWTPIGQDDNVSLNTYEWDQFVKHFPKVLEILGVKLG